ncbi:hypothetical protein Bca52824_089586 [Brassica carinata]|uniref:Uncharacterized protein n=1 Tax=Brassica carinata TaxID=52824 RepID=A0A8X7PFH2_BRACI|nr:hypothetical protein Bca52824_089586 [Brassica carinata]
MLCLKSEALHDNQTLAASSSSSSSPSIDRSSANATFRIPINWGSSIRRYLKKTGTFSRRSYSSGDGSLYFPDLHLTPNLLPLPMDRVWSDRKGSAQEAAEDIRGCESNREILV